jgi:hypothetical protein
MLILITINVLFFRWCGVRNPTRGMKVLEEMIQLGHTPGSFTYRASIDALCRLYERMIEVGCFRT